jgi:hypothetical protein
MGDHRPIHTSLPMEITGKCHIATRKCFKLGCLDASAMVSPSHLHCLGHRDRSKVDEGASANFSDEACSEDESVLCSVYTPVQSTCDELTPCTIQPPTIGMCSQRCAGRSL